jgi:[ribosomal protein S18]-alanine N-acetyltransferase
MILPPIRRAIPADLPHIRQLAAQASTAADWSPSQYDLLFAGEGPRRIARVAARESGAEIVIAFLVARCLDDEWEIENIVVDEKQRREGVGSALIRHLAAEAAASGARSILLEVRESNHQALRLYERIGFRCEGRRKKYYDNPAEDALLYRLPLQSCDKIP